MMALHPLMVPLAALLIFLIPRPSVGDIEGDDYDLNNYRSLNGPRHRPERTRALYGPGAWWTQSLDGPGL